MGPRVGSDGGWAMDAEQPPCAAYRFGRFTLDLARGALLALDGAELHLRPKSFALLQLLIENAGRLLDRDTIMRAVWHDVFVTDESITQCVHDIRRALGDEAQGLLRTVPRRGYLFTAEVSRAPAISPMLPGDEPGQAGSDGASDAPVEHPRSSGASDATLQPPGRRLPPGSDTEGGWRNVRQHRNRPNLLGSRRRPGPNAGT